MYNFFISSTYKDLKEERQEVITGVLETRNFPIAMEMFPASNFDQWDFIQKEIDSVDYYILIVGGKYGTIPANEQISYTEKEFDYVLQKGIPIISFVIEDIGKLPREKTETDSKLNRLLEKFTDKVKSGRVVKFYKNKEDLKSKVVVAIPQTIKDFERPGWVRETDEGKKSEKDIQVSKSENERQTPLQKIMKFLENPNDWENVPGGEEKKYYKYAPEYTITFSWNEDDPPTRCEYYFFDHPDQTPHWGSIKIAFNQTVLKEITGIGLDGYRFSTAVPLKEGLFDHSTHGEQVWYRYMIKGEFNYLVHRFYADQDDNSYNDVCCIYESDILIFENQREHQKFLSFARRTWKNKDNFSENIIPPFFPQIANLVMGKFKEDYVNMKILNRMLDAFRHQDNYKNTDTFDCRQQVLSPKENFLLLLNDVSNWQSKQNTQGLYYYHKFHPEFCMAQVSEFEKVKKAEPQAFFYSSHDMYISNFHIMYNSTVLEELEVWALDEQRLILPKPQVFKIPNKHDFWYSYYLLDSLEGKVMKFFGKGSVDTSSRGLNLHPFLVFKNLSDKSSFDLYLESNFNKYSDDKIYELYGVFIDEEKNGRVYSAFQVAKCSRLYMDWLKETEYSLQELN